VKKIAGLAHVISLDIVTSVTTSVATVSRTFRLDRLVASLPPRLADAVGASRLVLRLAAQIEQRLDTALAPEGITMRDYLALVLIADSEVEPLRPSDLGTTLDATRTQVTRLLDDLERRGLVQRLPGRGDRRTLELAQTPAAKELRERVASQVFAAYAEIWAEAGEQGTRQVRRLLGKVHKALGAPDLP